jgi:hypothetical protein
MDFYLIDSPHSFLSSTARKTKKSSVNQASSAASGGSYGGISLDGSKTFDM